MRQPKKAATRQSHGERIRINLVFRLKDYGRMSPGDLSDKAFVISGHAPAGAARRRRRRNTGTGASWIQLAPATVANRTTPAKGRIIQTKPVKQKSGDRNQESEGKWTAASSFRLLTSDS